MLENPRADVFPDFFVHKHVNHQFRARNYYLITSKIY